MPVKGSAPRSLSTGRLFVPFFNLYWAAVGPVFPSSRTGLMRPEGDDRRAWPTRAMRVCQAVANGQGPVRAGAVAHVHSVNGGQLAHYLDNPGHRPPAGAGTVHGVGLAVADAQDGLELERPAQECLGLAYAPALCQILQGVDHDKAVVLPNRPFHPACRFAVV